MKVSKVVLIVVALHVLVIGGIVVFEGCSRGEEQHARIWRPTKICRVNSPTARHLVPVTWSARSRIRKVQERPPHWCSNT